MQRTITVKANSERVERVSGRAFAVLSATAAFKLETGRDGRRDMIAGRRFVQLAQFQRLTFIETSGSDNTICFEAGDSELDISAPSTSGITVTYVKDAPTYTAGVDEYSLDPLSGINFSGSQAGAQRKQIAISNVSADQVLHVLDGAGGLLGNVIQPLQTWTFITSGVVYLYNPNGTAVSFTCFESFYL